MGVGFRSFNEAINTDTPTGQYIPSSFPNPRCGALGARQAPRAKGGCQGEVRPGGRSGLACKSMGGLLCLAIPLGVCDAESDHVTLSQW